MATARDDSSANDFLKQNELPHIKYARESKLYCDGNQIELMRQQAADTFALCFINSIKHEDIQTWWTPEQQRQTLREVTIQIPKIDHVLELYPEDKRDLILYAAIGLEAQRCLTNTGSLIVLCRSQKTKKIANVLDLIFGDKNHLRTIAWTHGFSSTTQISTSYPDVIQNFLWYQKDKAAFYPDKILVPCNKQYVLKQFRHKDPHEDDGKEDDEDDLFFKTKPGRNYRLNSLTGWSRSNGNLPPNALAPVLTSIPEEHRGTPEDNLRYAEENSLLEKTSTGSYAQKQYQDMTVDKGKPVSTLFAYFPGTAGTLHGSKANIGEPFRTLQSCLEVFLKGHTKDGQKVLLPFCSYVETEKQKKKQKQKKRRPTEKPCLLRTVIEGKRSWVAMIPNSRCILNPESAHAMMEDLRIENDPLEWQPTSYEEALALSKFDNERGEKFDNERGGKKGMLCQAFATNRVSLALKTKPVGPTKNGTDEGMDAVFILLDDDGNPHKLILSVKSGLVSKADRKAVESLGSTMTAEKASYGILYSWEPPTQPAREHMEKLRKEGQYIRIVTVREDLEGSDPIRRPVFPGS